MRQLFFFSAVLFTKVLFKRVRKIFSLMARQDRELDRTGAHHTGP